MITKLSPTTVTRLQKAASDNGFDIDAPSDTGWLGFVSTKAPLRVWLSAMGQDLYLVALSQLHVAKALGEYGTPMASPLPTGAAAGRTAGSISALNDLLRRAFQLSRTLPDELLHNFEKQTSAMPKSTQAERLVVQRVGQDIFRQGLLDYWEGRCAITGLAVPELLRASHIKPWSDCESDAERLDIHNGLLLAAHLDAAFDTGLITIEDTGQLRISPKLDQADPSARDLLNLTPTSQISLSDGHRTYLPWHREKVFRS